jgi:hypothetical protein
MCQHDFEGRRIFQHRNGDKWDLFLCNQRIPGFRLEDECREYVRALQVKWDGGLGQVAGMLPRAARVGGRRESPRIAAVMITCAERETVRRKTLTNLAQTDWGDLPLEVQVDEGEGDDHARRQTACAFAALSRALERPWDYVLFLEDDLEFNRFIRHNLEHWEPLRNGRAHLGSLYNPRLRVIANDVKSRSRIVPARIIFGSQALILSRPALRHVVSHWEEIRGMQDIRISRLAGQLHSGTFFHAPSLVQHVGKQSASGGGFHYSIDYDANWKAEARTGRQRGRAMARKNQMVRMVDFPIGDTFKCGPGSLERRAQAKA